MENIISESFSLRSSYTQGDVFGQISSRNWKNVVVIS